jgi:hypothetical protein
MAHRKVITPVHLFAGVLLLAPSLLAGSGSQLVSVAQAAEEMPKDMLAAQIRTRGFACDRALRAIRDARRSRPDHAVWVLKCSNATYRVGRAPDMAAKVVPLE